MASEIRVNSLTNRSGLGTITFGAYGVQLTGITTVEQLNVTSGVSNINASGISTFSDVKITGAFYDGFNNVGAGDSVLISTGIGVSWIDIATAALQGVQGVQGITGTQGTQGVQGIQGVQGTQGLQGTFGTQGVQGTYGTQGTQGIQGSGTGTADQIFEGNSYAEILDTGSNGIFRFLPEGNEVFRISTDGNTGIGTNNPILKAHIFNTASTDAALIESTQNYSTLRFKSATNTSGPTVGIDGAGGLQLDQKDTSKYISFAIGPERLRINSTGVGIKTNDPDAPLTIQESGDAQIRLKNSSGVTKAYLGTAGAFGSGSTDDLRIRSEGNILFGSAGSERFRITSNGQLLSNTTTDNAAIRANFAGTSWGGGNASGTNSGLSIPQFLFTGVGLDNSGTVTPIGFNIRGGGGGVPRGLCFAAHGSYQGNSATNHNVFFVRNVTNTGQTWATYNGVPGVGVQAGAADAYAGPHASGWWSPSFAATFGIKDVTTSTYDGGRKVGQTIELGGNYGGGSPNNWGGYCLALRIATNFGSGSNGTNYGLYADISGAGSGANWGVWINNGGAAKPGGGSWSSTSDERVKTVNSSYTRGLAEIAQLNPVNFTYNGKADTPTDGKEYVGLIAQEVQQIIPDMVESRSAKLEETDEEETDILMVDSSELVYALVNACKELKAQVETLQARLDAAGL